MAETVEWLSLEDRYGRIFDECLRMAAQWRSQVTDKGFCAEQHRRCLIRAARYARLADAARSKPSAIVTPISQAA